MKHDANKPRYTLLPAKALAMVVRVLTHGAVKYSPDNWHRAFRDNPEDGERRYLDASMRHIQAHRMGEITDPESGEPHLAHAVCSLLFILAWLAEEVGECETLSKTANCSYRMTPASLLTKRPERLPSPTGGKSRWRFFRRFGL